MQSFTEAPHSPAGKLARPDRRRETDLQLRATGDAPGTAAWPVQTPRAGGRESCFCRALWGASQHRGVNRKLNRGESKTKPKIQGKTGSLEMRGVQPIIPERAAFLGTNLNHVSQDLPVPGRGEEGRS